MISSVEREGIALAILYHKAEVYLKRWDSRQNQQKRKDRKKLLDDHPDLRITINHLNLQTILNYIDFKCSPLSSVALDQAIKGSDIDAGLVITDGKTSIQQQLTFRQALRREGFDVYHELERDEAVFRSLYPEKMTEESWGRAFLLSEEQIKRPGLIDFKTITFSSLEEITNKVRRILKGEQLTSPVAIYLTGASLRFNGSPFNHQ